MDHIGSNWKWQRKENSSDYTVLPRTCQPVMCGHYDLYYCTLRRSQIKLVAHYTEVSCVRTLRTCKTSEVAACARQQHMSSGYWTTQLSGPTLSKAVGPNVQLRSTSSEVQSTWIHFILGPKPMDTRHPVPDLCMTYSFSRCDMYLK
jgi:hypothetical protein